MPGTFGILIPPSVTMILYGVATETSIGKCFIAGILPGLLEIFLSCVWVAGVFFYRKRVPAQKGAIYYIEDRGEVDNFSWGERFGSLIKVLPFILIIAGIMLALYGGWATPSEAGGVGAVMAFVLVMIIYKVTDPPTAVGHHHQGPERKRHDPDDHGRGPDLRLYLLGPLRDPVHRGMDSRPAPSANGASSSWSTFCC